MLEILFFLQYFQMKKINAMARIPLATPRSKV
jgi:hypothetical protein